MKNSEFIETLRTLGKLNKPVNICHPDDTNIKLETFYKLVKNEIDTVDLFDILGWYMVVDPSKESIDRVLKILEFMFYTFSDKFIKKFILRKVISLDTDNDIEDVKYLVCHNNFGNSLNIGGEKLFIKRNYKTGKIDFVDSNNKKIYRNVAYIEKDFATGKITVVKDRNASEISGDKFRVIFR